MVSLCTTRSSAPRKGRVCAPWRHLGTDSITSAAAGRIYWTMVSTDTIVQESSDAWLSERVSVEVDLYRPMSKRRPGVTAVAGHNLARRGLDR
jgi:hypothetical protein